MPALLWISFMIISWQTIHMNLKKVLWLILPKIRIYSWNPMKNGFPGKIPAVLLLYANTKLAFELPVNRGHSQQFQGSLPPGKIYR